MPTCSLGCGGGSIRSAAQTVMRSATNACVVPLRGVHARGANATRPHGAEMTIGVTGNVMKVTRAPAKVPPKSRMHQL